MEHSFSIDYRGHVINIIRDDHQPDAFDHPINSYGNGVWEQGPSAECPDLNDLREWSSFWMRGTDLSAGFSNPEEFVMFFQGGIDDYGDHQEPEVPGTWEIYKVRAVDNRTEWTFSLDEDIENPMGMIAIKMDTDDAIGGSKADKQARDKLEWFKAYYNGEFYGYDIEETCYVGSCWGYLARDAWKGKDSFDLSTPIEEAKACIDAELDAEAARERMLANVWMKNKLCSYVYHNVPLIYREPNPYTKRLML